MLFSQNSALALAAFAGRNLELRRPCPVANKRAMALFTCVDKGNKVRLDIGNLRTASEI